MPAREPAADPKLAQKLAAGPHAHTGHTHHVGRGRSGANGINSHPPPPTSTPPRRELSQRFARVCRHAAPAAARGAGPASGSRELRARPLDAARLAALDPPSMISDLSAWVSRGEAHRPRPIAARARPPAIAALAAPDRSLDVALPRRSNPGQGCAGCRAWRSGTWWCPSRQPPSTPPSAPSATASTRSATARSA
jgi:hypothetical protein